jgi:hypothetical protein
MRERSCAMNRTLRIPLSGLVALCCTCGQLSLTGGSSQQGNGMIVGQVVSVNGSCVAAALIRIRPINYVQTPGAATNGSGVFDAVTDSMGNFSVSGISSGEYTIEANDRASSAVLATATIMEQSGTADVGTIGLKPYARIFGRVDAAPTEALPQKYVQVQGLERCARVGNDGTFAIVDLPEGSFDLRLVSADSTTASSELFGVNATSDATASVVIPSGWRYARRLHLNTTASGADVAGSVTNFPVLIRLAADNFDFSQAASDGADIRFTKSDNTILPHEIERWDAVNTLAEIWVRMDTVRGGDSTQFLTLLWGNETAAYRSDGAAVFDTATGFAGVWHLNDIGSTIYDATGHAFNGINSGSNITTGIIGHSRKFANGNYIRIPGLLESPFNVTLSAWVLSDTSLARGQDIVSIGDAVLIRLDDILGMGTAGCYHNTALISDTSYVKVNSGQYLAKTGWHYLAFSINAVTHAQTLYIDGIQSVISHDVNPINYAGMGADTYLGIHRNGKTGFNFIGRIDEVRVNSTAVSPDWIKLSFMNQKAADKLVKW